MKEHKGQRIRQNQKKKKKRNLRSSTRGKNTKGGKKGVKPGGLAEEVKGLVSPFRKRRRGTWVPVHQFHGEREPGFFSWVQQGGGKIWT